MLRQLTAIIMVVVTSFVLFISPVHAESIPINFFNQNSNNITDNNVFSIDSDIWSDPFVESMIDTAKVTAGTAIGGAIVCYSINGLATGVFPPAVALLPYCPAIGAIGGSNAVTKMVKPSNAFNILSKAF